MATKDLTFNLYGKDRSASSTMNRVGGNAQSMGQAFRRVGQTIAVGLAVATVAVAAFAVQAVQQFAVAETAQNKLTFAYEKFPDQVDMSISALRKLNSELALTTKYDDDVTASAQAVLLKFKLTATQIAKLTPLVQDYASATGKDLVTAAEDVGKALLGQGRALKEIGVDWEDTGTVAGNFTAIMAALSAQVGGFAEKEGATAAGQLEILNNRFGEFQESIGEKLMPSLVALMDYFEANVMPGLETFTTWLGAEGVPGLMGFVGWWETWGTVVGPAAVVVVGALTGAFGALSLAMSANPIGLFIAGVIAGIAWWSSFVGMLTGGIGNIQFSWQLLGFAWATTVNQMIGALNFLLGPLNAVIGAINFITGANLSAIKIGTIAANTPDAYLNQPGGRTGGVPRLAGGALVPAQAGGIMANIGEGRDDEVVLPLNRRILSQIGGGGPNITINVRGSVGDEDHLAKTVQRATRRALGRGAVGVSA